VLRATSLGRFTEAANFSYQLVFELRHRLQLILGGVEDSVIRIPIAIGLPIFRCRCRRACGPNGTVGGSTSVAVCGGYRVTVVDVVVLEVVERGGSFDHFNLS
jgi:hypothetical protein